MDKETLSNYGWIVIAVLVLVVMIALAGPFGNFVAEAVKSTTQGLFDTNKNALDAAGITIDENAFVEGENGPNNGNGLTDYTSYNHNAPELHLTGVIPEGGRYVHEATNTIVNGPNGMMFDSTSYELTAGDPFPETVYKTDSFYYGDYVYTTKNVTILGDAASPYTLTGWRFEVIDKTKETYTPVLESIAGTKVTSAYKAFAGCSNLTSSPVIPESATECFWDVWYGTKVTEVQKGIIPDGTKSINNIFTSGTFPETAKIVYLPESVEHVQRGYYVQLGNVDTLSISCITTIEQFGGGTDNLTPDKVVYYHHSACDGSCGK